MGRDSEKRFHISPQQIIASAPHSYSGVFMVSARGVFANESGLVRLYSDHSLSKETPPIKSYFAHPRWEIVKQNSKGNIEKK
jgi:hypothetical protein